MENILCRGVEIVLISLYLEAPFDVYRVCIWGGLMVTMQASVLLMASNSEEIHKTEIACIVLYCLYLLGGIIFSFYLSYFWAFLLTFTITSALIVLRFSPPFSLEKKGSGGIFRVLLEGWFWVLLHSLALTDSPKFIVIEYLPVFFVFEAWYLIKEIESSSFDTQHQHITTGMLMGKHGCFRVFMLLHIFSWCYLGLDMNFGVIRGLPLVLLPWSVHQIRKVKTLKFQSLKREAFLYYLFFSALVAVSLIYKN